MKKIVLIKLEALNLVQLDTFVIRNIQQLSGGQQQRVAIAHAIINQTHILLLDEPLIFFDYRLRKAMQSELKQLQKTLTMTFFLSRMTRKYRFWIRLT